MRGSKREKRPGVWELRVYMGTIDGHRYDKSRTFRGSARNADRELRKLLDDVEAGRIGPRRVVGTVAEMMVRWCEDRRRDWAPRTHSENKAFVKRYITGTKFGRMDASRVRPVDVKAFVKGLADTVGVPTARRAHTHLSSAFSEAVRVDELVVNPCAKVRPPKALPRVEREVSIADVVKVMSLAASKAKPGKMSPMAVLIRVALATAARRGELGALRWSDINLKTGVVKIGRALTAADGGVTVKGTKTGKTKLVHLDAGTVTVLAAWKRYQATEHLKVGETQSQGWYVWTRSPDGADPWHPDTISARWIDLRDEAKVTLRFHDIRHATQSFLVSEGFGMGEIAERGGQSVEVLGNTYTHADPTRAQAIADRLGGAIEVALAPAVPRA